MKSELKETPKPVEVFPALYKLKKSEKTILVYSKSFNNLDGVVVATTESHQSVGFHSTTWSASSFVRLPKGTQVVLTQE